MSLFDEPGMYSRHIPGRTNKSLPLVGTTITVARKSPFCQSVVTVNKAASPVGTDSHGTAAQCSTVVLSPQGCVQRAQELNGALSPCTYCIGLFSPPPLDRVSFFSPVAIALGSGMPQSESVSVSRWLSLLIQFGGSGCFQSRKAPQWGTAD